ncbi:hypothetical protein BgiMline_029177, partial [Biomphalaria glabrata]
NKPPPSQHPPLQNELLSSHTGDCPLCCCPVALILSGRITGRTDPERGQKVHTTS